MKNLDLKFEQWKKRKLDEGFLDGEEEKPVAAEDEAPAAETEESGDAGTDADMGGDDTSSEEAPSEDTDISEEGGEETTEDDGLDDDFEGETKEETGVEDGDEGQMNELKDAIATLTAQLQTLTDQLKKTNGEDVGGEEAPAEGEGEGESETTEETAEPEEGTEESSEGGEETSEGGEETSEESGEETSEETSEEAPADETKSEAYNKYCKKGGILAENSGYLISYLNEGRYDKLEDKIMAVVNAKIRQRIDAAKTKLKTEAFNKKFGK